MSIAAPKMPWKACDSSRFRVTFGVGCDRKQIGPETRWNARPALTTNDHEGIDMASRFYRQGRNPAIDTHREQRAFGMEARP
jgi:hypothetical protein